MKNFPQSIQWCILCLFICIVSCQKDHTQTIDLNEINPDQLQFRFTTISSISHRDERMFEPIDLNMDGKSEVIQIDNIGLNIGEPSFVQILEKPFDKLIVRYDFRGKISLSGVKDYDQDNKQEIFVSELINDTVYVTMFAVQRREIIKQHRCIGAIKS